MRRGKLPPTEHAGGLFDLLSLLFEAGKLRDTPLVDAATSLGSNDGDLGTLLMAHSMRNPQTRLRKAALRFVVVVVGNRADRPQAVLWAPGPQRERQETNVCCVKVASSGPFQFPSFHFTSNMHAFLCADPILRRPKFPRSPLDWPNSRLASTCLTAMFFQKSIQAAWPASQHTVSLNLLDHLSSHTLVLPTRRHCNMVPTTSRLGLLLLITTLALQVQSNVSRADGGAQNSKQTLLIVDKTNNIPTFKQTHTILIKLIQDLGHNVDIRAADDSSLKLAKYGEFLYDDILLLCPQADVFRGNLHTKDLLEFIDAGGNVLLAGSNAPGAIANGLASEVGFEFKETSVKREYANTKLNDIYHIIGDRSKFPSTSFSFAGAQMKMLRNELSLEILNNNAPIDDIRPNSIGKYHTNVLVGVMQARNNARVIVSGSVDFFTDKAFEKSQQANKHLTNELLSWLFKEKSLLRYSQVSHKKLNVDPAPSTDLAMQTHFEGYTIMDDLEYSIKIEILENGQWVPYTGDDVQFEFVRIDPFVRQTMQRRSDGSYVAKFKVPDVYGVYKMEVDYKKDGLTYLFSSTQVSVRPLRHNEYERFIYSAYPYYLSAFLMMAYLYVFSFVYLYQQKEKRSNK